MVSYPNISSESAIASPGDQTSYLANTFALDLTEEERQLLSSYTLTHPHVIVRGKQNAAVTRQRLQACISTCASSRYRWQAAEKQPCLRASLS